jgi:hypothetical protein
MYLPIAPTHIHTQAHVPYFMLAHQGIRTLNALFHEDVNIIAT